jgi:hypothetical protein
MAHRKGTEEWCMEKGTYGFRPWGLRGFCLGSVGSYGTFAEDGAGVGDQRAMIYRTLEMP